MLGFNSYHRIDILVTIHIPWIAIKEFQQYFVNNHNWKWFKIFTFSCSRLQVIIIIIIKKFIIQFYTLHSLINNYPFKK